MDSFVHFTTPHTRTHTKATNNKLIKHIIVIMGNALSEEEQEQIMEEAYNLEDPEADKKLNSGTSAPNCQPKHTQRDEQNDGSQGGADSNNNNSGSLQEGQQQQQQHPGTHKNQRSSSSMSVREAQEDRRKRQHTNTTTQSAGTASSSSQSSLSSSQQQEQQEISSAAAQQQKKLSYFQMARLGYQELVNAIIRPPRADYKVR
ncbi:MAG: hypothetical protein ACI8RD_013004 [Bacillariaceae sp.]